MVKHTQTIRRAFKEALSKVYFPNYENFGDVNKGYENFVQKLMIVIYQLAPRKTKRVTGISQEWFDEEVLECIALRYELFKKFKRINCMQQIA